MDRLEGSGVVGRLAPGTVVNNRYFVREPIGDGGMGSVYLVTDQLLNGSVVALKIVNTDLVADCDVNKRFIREVELMHSINHPNVVRTFDVGTHDGRMFYTMEYVKGVSICGLNPKFAFDSSVMADLILQICDGLRAIHSQGIIHRDLKPENILVTPEFRVKIMDFGVARKHSSRLTHPEAIIGSTGYLAPEVWQGGDVSPAIDFYSLGVILYEFVTQSILFDSDNLATMMWMHINTVPPPPVQLKPKTPPWLNELIVLLLEKHPEERLSTAEAVAGFVRNPPLRAPVAAGAEPEPESCQRAAGAVPPAVVPEKLPVPAVAAGGETPDQAAFNRLLFQEMPSADDIVRHEQEVAQAINRSLQETDELTERALKEEEKRNKLIRVTILATGLAVVSATVLLFIILGRIRPVNRAAAVRKESVQSKNLDVEGAIRGIMPRYSPRGQEAVQNALLGSLSSVITKSADRARNMSKDLAPAQDSMLVSAFKTDERALKTPRELAGAIARFVAPAPSARADRKPVMRSGEILEVILKAHERPAPAPTAVPMVPLTIAPAADPVLSTQWFDEPKPAAPVSAAVSSRTTFETLVQKHNLPSELLREYRSFAREEIEALPAFELGEDKQRLFFEKTEKRQALADVSSAISSLTFISPEARAEERIKLEGQLHKLSETALDATAELRENLDRYSRAQTAMETDPLIEAERVAADDEGVRELLFAYQRAAADSPSGPETEQLKQNLTFKVAAVLRVEVSFLLGNMMNSALVADAIDFSRYLAQREIDLLSEPPPQLSAEQIAAERERLMDEERRLNDSLKENLLAERDELILRAFAMIASLPAVNEGNA